MSAERYCDMCGQVTDHPLPACPGKAGSELAPVSGSDAAVECEESVILKIRQRRDAGRRKYGTSMERTDLTKLDWLRHAQEEAMDLAIYLEKLIQAEQQQNDKLTHGGNSEKDSR